MSKPDILTEKGAPSLSTTGSARVNFFFKAVRGLAEDEARLHQMLSNCWNEDQLDTLKLIFQTRDCRGGKGEKAIFRGSIRWLAAQHPQTLQKNIQHIPFYGTWKDLLTLIGTNFEGEALDLFAKQLKDDLAVATSATEGKKPSISLAVKWAPTEDHKDDKACRAAGKLAKRLCKHSKTHLKDYRKNYLTPLRAYLRVTEVYMSANKWGEIEYSHVPSRCMNLNRKAFAKHDGTRFNKFLEDAKAGKTEIKGKQMFPHELAKYYFNNNIVDDVVELQWKTIIDDLKKSGSLSDSIVLSDVSGSMSGTPMEVSVALGLLISEVTAAPFTNVVITFHEKPSFHVVKGNSLMARVQDIKRMDWGGTTNFQAVFDLMLQRAREHRLPASAMPKRLFVISDMQFDDADMGGGFKTNHQVIKHKYAAAGYSMPTIIYWNVRANTKDFPVSHDERGVALVSGFSPAILKDLVDTGEFSDPFSVMKKAISNERYNVLTL
jgi:hypothetical protein